MFKNILLGDNCICNDVNCCVDERSECDKSGCTKDLSQSDYNDLVNFCATRDNLDSVMCRNWLTGDPDFRTDVYEKFCRCKYDDPNALTPSGPNTSDSRCACICAAVTNFEEYQNWFKFNQESTEITTKIPSACSITSCAAGDSFLTKRMEEDRSRCPSQVYCKQTDNTIDVTGNRPINSIIQCCGLEAKDDQKCKELLGGGGSGDSKGGVGGGVLKWVTGHPATVITVVAVILLVLFVTIIFYLSRKSKTN